MKVHFKLSGIDSNWKDKVIVPNVGMDDPLAERRTPVGFLTSENVRGRIDRHDPVSIKKAINC